MKNRHLTVFGLALALTLTACRNPNFSLGSSGNEVKLDSSSSSTLHINLAPFDGFDQPVVLSVSGLPSGTTATFTPNPATSSGSDLKLESASAAPGSYPVVVHGVGGGLSRSFDLKLTVNALVLSSTFKVDTSLQPLTATIPGIDGGEARPVAALEDANGIKTDFVENELLISTDDPSALNAFVSRWNGTVLSSFKPSDEGLTGVKPYYVVRVKASSADSAGLAKDLETLSPNIHSNLKFSSQAGLDLMAVAAHESASNGLNVGLNFILESNDIASGHTTEGTNGENTNAKYSKDVADWSYMKRGGNQDIGVTDAWRGLSAAGKLGNKVKLAVLDGGFIQNQDIPANWIMIPSNGWNQQNPANCVGLKGDHPCPWHGTGTAIAAMGVPDNSFGAAGPAGPVARPILVQSPSPDFFSYLKYMLSLVKTLAVGPKIVNISASTNIVAIGAVFVNGLGDPIFAGLRALDILVVAAAGNINYDVDAKDCFIVCWERSTTIPCEFSKVLCVGALAWDSSNRANYSNYGSVNEDDSVNIFGPGTLWLPDDASLNGSSGTNIFTAGTSVASPFVAGVAALVSAAKPSLNADQIESILLTTAHTNTSDGTVRRWVNALGAIKKVLGNIPPTATIGVTPDVFDSSRYTFSANTDDLEDGLGCCTVEWSSSADGALGTGLTQTTTFPTLGQRQIKAKITDSQGGVGYAEVSIKVDVPLPDVKIDQPNGGNLLERGKDYTFLGHAWIAPATDLCGNTTNPNVNWTSGDPSNTLPNPIPQNCRVNLSFAQNGNYQVWLEVKDAYGRTGKAVVSFIVTDPKPEFNIQLKGSDLEKPIAFANVGEVVLLAANTYNGTAPYKQVWTWQSTRANCSEVVLKPKPPFSVPPGGLPYQIYVFWNTTDMPIISPLGCDSGDGIIKLVLTDANDQTASASRAFQLLSPPN